MSGARFVVGYTADDSGADALALATRFARASEGQLEIVMVLPSEARNSTVPGDRGYEQYLKATSRDWLVAASDRLGADIAQSLHIRYAESFAEGLIDAAHEFSANFIVVGAARGGLLGRSRIGPVASELLHSSDVPVVLAPAGSREIADGAGISRITAAVGARLRGGGVLDTALLLARATRAPLRLLSLVPVDLPSGLDPALAELTGVTHIDDVLEIARRRLPAGIDATAIVAQGSSTEEAVRSLDWHSGEVVIVGSSRLAAPRRLFLGSTASKMLRELPVPMIVAPRNSGSADTASTR